MNAKYTITNRPSMIRYTPNALKSFFLIYPSKNLIAPIDTRNDITIPTISTINCVDVNARPNFTIFNKLAPNITGIPKKNENSAGYYIEREDLQIMRCVGIIGAMEQEVAKIKEKMQDVTITSRARMDFYEGTLEGKKVVVVRSGIGKVNAGMCTQILADVFGVEAVINTGIAGSLNNDVNIGDIVLSTDVLHHDMDAIGFGYKKGQIPQMDEFSFPADEKLRKLAAKVCKEVNPEISVFEGRICSGDQFISDKSVKDAIISEFGGFAVEMEGAAIGQAAYLNHIPFLVVRAISDKADGSAHMDYAEFEMAAIEHSVKLTVRMIQEL